MPEFPPGFLWGAATAAYQVEGAVDEDGRGPSIWDTFSHTPGRTHNGDTGDRAADHYHRLDGDLDLVADLGLSAYRFSVAWPRVQPDGRGGVNRKGLDFYRRLVDGLRARSVAPVPTLYHWDLPQPLQDTGGWLSRDTAERFADYAQIVCDALGDTAAMWTTVNEPQVAAFTGYGSGGHAPGLAGGDAAAVTAAHHLLLGHGLAAGRLRGAGARVGIALNLVPCRPESPADAAAAHRLDGYINRLFLDPVLGDGYPRDLAALLRPVTDFGFVRDGDLDVIATPLDFLGVNYYSSHLVRRPGAGGPGTADPVPQVDAEVVRPAGPTTTMGWALTPEAFTELLLRLHARSPGLPLYVTENGIACADYADPAGAVKDPERVAFLHAHLAAAHAALAAGVDLRGYFVWSLLDNFEWSFGYSQRFGLVHVDYPTGWRTPKASAWWYRRVARGNRLVGPSG